MKSIEKGGVRPLRPKGRKKDAATLKKNIETAAEAVVNARRTVSRGLPFLAVMREARPLHGGGKNGRFLLLGEGLFSDGEDDGDGASGRV